MSLGNIAMAKRNDRGRPGKRSWIRKLQSFQNTDAGNAEAFELLFGNRFRYDHTKSKWLVWNGRYWAEDVDGEADRAALATARHRLLAAIQVKRDHERRGVRWAIRSESVYGRKATLISAQTIASLKTTTVDYDKDQFVLTVGNGTLDLRTGNLREASPSDLITRATDIPFDPSAQAPRWAQFLNEVFGGERDVIEYVQRAVGYSLTGDTREQCFFMLTVSGANGKSTFLETIVRLLGTNATTAAFSTFLVQRNQGSPRNDLAALCGARFVKAAEAEHRAKLDESLVKALTGQDTISARRLFCEAFEFRPQFKLWLASNHRPQIWETSDAIWRRVKLIEFNQQFTGSRMDPTLRTRLEAELPGILTWAVQGCLSWQQIGLKEPERISQATKGYRQESDQVGRFLKERCDLQADRQTAANRLYDDYMRWCAKNNEKPVANNLFATKLADRGIGRKRAAKGMFYRGVVLLPSPPIGSVATTPPEGKPK